MPISPNAEKRLLAEVDAAYNAQEQELERVLREKEKLGCMLGISLRPLLELDIAYHKLAAKYLELTGEAYTPPFLRKIGLD